MVTICSNDYEERQQQAPTTGTVEKRQAPKAVVVKVWSKDPPGDPRPLKGISKANYFHGNTKMLFDFFTFIVLRAYRGIFHKLHGKQLPGRRKKQI
jgi:hypothetical protein